MRRKKFEKLRNGPRKTLGSFFTFCTWMHSVLRTYWKCRGFLFGWACDMTLNVTDDWRLEKSSLYSGFCFLDKTCQNVSMSICPLLVQYTIYNTLFSLSIFLTLVICRLSFSSEALTTCWMWNALSLSFSLAAPLWTWIFSWIFHGWWLVMCGWGKFRL